MEKNPINSKGGIRDISHLVQTHEANVLQLKGLLDRKAAYLRKHPDHPYVARELDQLRQFLVATHEVLERLVTAYRMLSGDYLSTYYELKALKHALPEDRSSYLRSREVLGFWHLVHRHELPKRRLPIEVIRKAEALDRKIYGPKREGHGKGVR